MIRVKSNAVWHSLPGVVAAYQPIAAPDQFAARQNVAHQDARFGVYTATPGVLPAWNATTGWYFSHTSGYLTTGLVPAGKNWSYIVRVGSWVKGANVFFCAFQAGTGTTNSRVGIWHLSGTTRDYLNTDKKSNSGGLSENGGMLGISGPTAYLNGIADGAIPQTSALPSGMLHIGKAADYLTSYGTSGYITELAVYERSLAPAEMWLASRQMKYCHINPDWNAWARRRRYYYAPQAADAAFNPAWARNTNTLLGGGFD